MWSSILSYLLGSAGLFLRAALQQLSDKKVFDQVLSVAEKHVGELSSVSTMSNSEKRAAAMRRIFAELEPIGIMVGEALVGLAIELAVNALKTRLGKSG
jgi:hypothetical protein